MNWDTPTLAVNEWVTQINGISLTMKRKIFCIRTFRGTNGASSNTIYAILIAIDMRGSPLLAAHIRTIWWPQLRRVELMQLPTWGFVRGDELAHQPLNPTLDYCVQQGMQLVFLSRSCLCTKRSLATSANHLR